MNKAVVTVSVDLIDRVLEELRMIKMKDTGAVYDTTLRLDLQLTKQKASTPAGEEMDSAETTERLSVPSQSSDIVTEVCLRQRYAEDRDVCGCNKCEPQADSSDDERDAFERWYCDDAFSTVGLVMSPEEIASMRKGNTYGRDRTALNSKWEGWSARANMKGGSANRFGAINTNSGHGHAWARPDGVKNRCGGVRLCQECTRDAALVAEAIDAAKAL